MYDDLMKFLDLAVRTTKEHAKNLRDIEEKSIYYKHSKELEDARRVMIKEFFAFDDYMETGKYEVPEIKFTTVKYTHKIV
jgi:hypothetical protein